MAKPIRLVWCGMTTKIPKNDNNKENKLFCRFFFSYLTVDDPYHSTSDYSYLQHFFDENPHIY